MREQARWTLCAAALAIASASQAQPAEPPPAPPPPAPAPAPAPASEVPSPAPAAQPELERVEGTAGARWSPSLGFVAAGTLPGEQAPEEATLAVVQPMPGRRGPAPAVHDSGSKSDSDGDDEESERESLGLITFGLGRLGFEPEPVARGSTSGDEVSFENSSALELEVGMQFIFAGGERIGGVLGLGLATQFGSVEAREGEFAEPKKYSVFGAPLWARGGLDVHITSFLDVGPRVGGQVGPYTLTAEPEEGSSASSSTRGQSNFSFMYEYGGALRLSLGQFQLEPGLVWRHAGDVTGQFLTADARFGLDTIYFVGWWETRLSTSGDNAGFGTAEAFARGMPEASRLGAGIGIKLL